MICPHRIRPRAKNNRLTRAIFFDRDDTLIVDVPYNGDPEYVELMPGAREACRLLFDLGYKLIIISNQSGVGRGMITPEQVQAVNERILELLGKELFTAVYCCYDAPDQPNSCRKPSPHMLLQAQKEHQLDLGRSFMIGDKTDDVLAGRNAGCRTVWLNPKGRPPTVPADFTASDLRQAALWIKRMTQEEQR